MQGQRPVDRRRDSRIGDPGVTGADLDVQTARVCPRTVHVEVVALEQDHTDAALREKVSNAAAEDAPADDQSVSLARDGVRKKQRARFGDMNGGRRGLRGFHFDTRPRKRSDRHWPGRRPGSKYKILRNRHSEPLASEMREHGSAIAALATAHSRPGEPLDRADSQRLTGLRLPDMRQSNVLAAADQSMRVGKFSM